MNATAVAMQPEAQSPAVVSDAGSILAVIGRAASDPATDVDKLERLMGLYERIRAGTARAAYTEALAAMQPNLPVIQERGGILDKNRNVQSTYALWEDINEAIKPVLAAHGFAISFRTGQGPDGRVLVTGVLSHRDGHSEETTLVLPIDSSGSKNAVQAVGSSTSYGKRYTASALLNLTSRGEDDDARTTGGPVRQSSAANKRAGLWEALQADLMDCQTVRQVEKCQQHWRGAEYPKMNAAWREQAEEAFEKRAAEITAADLPGTLRDSLKDPSINDRLRDDLTRNVDACDTAEELHALANDSAFKNSVDRLPVELKAAVRAHWKAVLSQRAVTTPA